MFRHKTSRSKTTNAAGNAPAAKSESIMHRAVPDRSLPLSGQRQTLRAARAAIEHLIGGRFRTHLRRQEVYGQRTGRARLQGNARGVVARRTGSIVVGKVWTVGTSYFRAQEPDRRRADVCNGNGGRYLGRLVYGPEVHGGRRELDASAGF